MKEMNKDEEKRNNTFIEISKIIGIVFFILAFLMLLK